jgi:hypothetical protein
MSESNKELAKEHKRVVGRLKKAVVALKTSNNDAYDKMVSKVLSGELKIQSKELLGYIRKAKEESLGERFFDTGGPGPDGGQGKAAGGGPGDSSDKTDQGTPTDKLCKTCGGLLTVRGSSLYCPKCNTTVNEEFSIMPYEVTPRAGSGGIYNTPLYGYIRVPGGPIDTNTDESRGKLLVKRLGERTFSIHADGATREHDMFSAAAAFNERLRALGCNEDRMFGEFVNWLYLESKPGEMYVWDFINGARTVYDQAGFKKHHRNSGI